MAKPNQILSRVPWWIQVPATLIAGWLIGIGVYNPLPRPEHIHGEHAAEPRSAKWPAVRKAYLDKHPTCEACGGTEGLQVHHVLPFHLYPERELDPENLITLCTGGSHNCHFLFGHALDFKAYNPHVREDAATMLKHIRERKYEVTPMKKAA